MTDDDNAYAESLAGMTLPDLITTYRHAQTERVRLWWRALIAHGLHPENRGCSAVVFTPGNPEVARLEAHTERVWRQAEELERRGICPESIK